MKSSLSRRTLLKGMAWGLPAAVALPTLDMMLNDNGTAYATGVPLPRRLGIWYWGSGVHKSRFFPTQTGLDWELTPELAPLAGVRSHLNVLSGYDIKSGGIVHHVGTAVMKTGQTYVDLGGGAFNTDVAVPSFDVTVANSLGEGLALRRLDVGVYSDGIFNGEGLNTRALSHEGPNIPNYAETDPRAVFDRLFASQSVGIEQIGRSSVLDAVAADTSALLPRLGSADKARVERHLELIRSIERRLVAGAVSCQAPARPNLQDSDLEQPDFVLINELMVDMIGLAFACDQTRVFTFRHHGWTDDPVFTNLGASARHHSLTHNEGGDQPTVRRINEFTMGQFAKLLARLSSTAEGAGTVLDNCAIMAYSEVAEGRDHSREDVPLIVAGRAGGALRTGLHHRGDGESATAVHLTLARALGLNWPSFGEDENEVTSTVSEIEA
jgi:hypothetical protein